MTGSDQHKMVTPRLILALQLLLFTVLGVSATLVIASPKIQRSAILILLALLIAMTLTRGLGKMVRAIKSLTWWQILWLLLFVSGLVFRDRDLHAVETEPLDGSAMFRIALVCITAVVLLFRLSLRKTNWLQYLARGLTGILGSYCLVCLASCLWSVYPAWSGYKSLEFLVDVIALAAVVATAVSVETYKSLFDLTWFLVGLLLASVWLGVLIWPQDALVAGDGIIGVMLSGVMPDVSPNSVGELGAILGVVASCRLLRSSNNKSTGICYAFLLIAALVTMGLAQGRSAILGFAVGILLIFVFYGRVAVAVVLGFIGAVVVSLGSVWETLLAFMSRGENEQNLYSLSDRVNWWSLAWPKILEHPFTGYGAFAGAKFLVMAQNKIDAGIHSDWVEILVGTGVLGFVLGMLVLAGTWWHLIGSIRHSLLRHLEHQMAIEAIGVLGVISIRSIFSPDLFWHPPIVFFAIVGYAEFSRLRRKCRDSISCQLLAHALESAN